MEKKDIVLIGKWLYDNAIECDVAIQKRSVICGSGDYEDPPEVRDDRTQENYYIWFASPNEPGTFRAGGGYGLTIEEAKSIAENLVNQKIQWFLPK